MAEAILKRLPIAPRLKTREWWGTYVWRLSIAGHFDPPSFLIAYLREVLQLIERHDSFESPNKTYTYKDLSILTGHSVETIYSSTVHNFSSILPVSADTSDALEVNERTFTFLKDGFADFLWPSRALHYCPNCLEEFGYMPMEWLFKLYPVCIHHQRILISTCPHCNGSLNAQAIQTQKCKHCEGNLTKTETVLILKSDRAFLVSECIVEMLSKQELPAFLKKNLPDDFTVQAALTLMALTFNWLSSNVVSKDWHTVSGLFQPSSQTSLDDVSSPYYRASVAFGILEDWPYNFYELMDTLRLQNLGMRHLSYAGIDWLFFKWFLSRWNSPEYRVIHQAFAPYFYQEMNKNPHRELSRYDRFVKENGYWDKDFSDKYIEWRKNRSTTKSQLSSILKLSEPVLNDIMASRLIEKISGFGVGDSARYSTFSAQSLLQRVRASVKSIDAANSELISFETALSIGWKPSRLIKMIILSELMAYVSSDSLFSYFGDLFFRSNDLDRLIR